KLVKAPAIETAAADNVVASLAQCHNAHKLGSMPTGSSQPSNASFEVCHALLQDIRRWIHNPRINVAKFAQRKEVGRVFCVAELIACGLIDRYSTAARRRIWGLA